PALTRLSSGDRGQIKEATALSGSPRPMSGRFLNPDHSNPWVQTSSGSCTKRPREVVLPINIAEGREPERSVRLRHARRPSGQRVVAPEGGPGGASRAHGSGPPTRSQTAELVGCNEHGGNGASWA